MATKPKDSTVFLKGIEPYLDKNLDKNTNKLMMYIKKYIDGKSPILFDIGPGKRLVFSDADKDIVYEVSGLDDKIVNTLVKECPIIDSSWNIITNPNLISLVYMVRYYMLKKKKKEMEFLLYYLTLENYSSVQYKYFQYEANEAIMEYTVNNLSNKYLLKQKGNLFAALQATALTSHETYSKLLATGTDEALKTYLAGLRTRIDKFVKNIAVEFYDNWENGNYLNNEKDDYSEENYHVSDNVSFAIEKLANSATMDTISRGADAKLITWSSKICGVSVNAVRNAITDIIQKKDQDIKTLYTLILQLYLSEGSHNIRSVGSTEFIVFCQDIYIKSNTNDEAILRIKSLLDDWLKECSPQYQRTERVATLANYRKSIYLYCVFVLNKVAKG